MRINYDCIRELLIVLEDNLIINDNLDLPKIYFKDIEQNPIMRKYSRADIAYSAQILFETDFIDCRIIYSDNQIENIVFFSITFAGHQYIESIKNDTLWNKLKSKIINHGLSLSFELIKSTAIPLAVAMLNS